MRYQEGICAAAHCVTAHSVPFFSYGIIELGGKKKLDRNRLAFPGVTVKSRGSAA